MNQKSPEYKLVEIPGDDSHWGISFEDVTVKIGQISVTEEDDSCILHFNYVIIDGEIPTRYNHDLDKFKITIGDILTNIIEEKSIKTINDAKEKNDSN